ncbi:MAG TPA: sigma-70 family RNA polymerase sigma factor [Chitinophagaceae bacterium]|nr:sigma-70 family RNA polymerase sigma factor [Chitinophagaceae bacterium]
MSFLKNIATSTLSDEELVALFNKRGNLADLGSLYQRYMDLVYGVCLKYLKDSEEAKDSTLSIFEELIDKLQKHEVAIFKGWLYQLAKNHCLMRLRKDKKFVKANVEVSFMQNEEVEHLNGVLEKEENFKQLQSCLEQLGKEQRQVLELFYLEQKCYKDIVTETGLDWNKVRSFIQNGRRNLKICIENKSLKSTSV